MKTTCTAFVLFLQILQCLALDDSQFILRNKDTGFCLVKLRDNCYNLRWTTGQRLLDAQAKCLGVQGKSVGSEVNFHECDENSDLQKWECKNGTVLALKDQQLYIELTADNTAVLSRTIGPNNHLTIEGTSSGACSRTHRELFTIGGNAAGMPCMFPFLYNNQWYSDCTTFDSLEQQLWCAVETKYQSERWGFCPVNSKEGWTKHPTTGAYYQFNTQSALTWSQADASCKQQGASLLSITDPHEYAYVTALLGNGGNKLWIGLILDPRQGWQWSNGKPYRYLKWDSGHPLPNPGHNCAIADPAVLYLWQSSLCTKRMGYICYSTTAAVQPTQAAETGFCSSPWIPYNGHCFHLNRTEKSWSDAQRWCHDERGDLVSIHNVEDQSFVISQLGYASADELWIGLNDITTEGLFDWSDHSTVSFTSWEFGKPAVSSDIKDCAVIRGENGNWADRVCAEKHGFICMKKSASKPTGDEVRQDEGCKTGWRRHGSYCYFIGTQTKSFDEAKDDCKSSDSYLADVSNAVDNAFLVSLVGLRPEKYFWLGLSNQENVDRFMWTNTNSVTFTHWNAEMPGHRQGCVAMTTGVFAGLWDVLLCTNKEKYICKHQAEGTASTPAPSSATPTSCSMGWNRIPLRNYCYKIFIQPSSRMKTWYEARDYCKAIGGDLLSIHSAEELDGLSTGYYSHSKVWIGLSAPDPVTGYVWSDGSPVQFQHWEDGEPNNKNNVESCTEFHMEKKGTSGSWNDVHCEMYHNWICQIRTGVTPKSSEDSVTPDYNKTSDGWIEWNGAQYYVIRSSMAMEEIRRFCQMKHGDLVTINSEAESVFLWKQVSRLYGSYWIGLNVELDKTYEWMDGSPVLFQRWDDNEPHFQRNDENCAFMTAYTGFWHVANCGAENSGICKRSGSPHANATVPPTVIPQGGCPENWKQLDSKCFNIVNKEKATWYAAREQCKSMGGNLASIVSKKEQVFLATQLMEAPDTNLWIGLHSTRDSSFLWTDGRRMRYTNWGFTSHTYHAYHPFMHHSFNDQDYYILPEIFQDKGCAVLNTAIASGIGKWIKKSCNDTNGYVCLRNVDPSFPVSAEPTTYLGYVKIFNDSIKFVSQKMNWDAAKKNCESDGGKLANLRNVWSKVYVEWLSVNTNDLIWIGLNKKETGGYYRYVDGWRLTETSWSRGEPRTNQPCVYVEVPGTWRTGDCSENFNSICMKSTDVPPTEPSGFPGYCPNDADTHHRSHRMSNSWLPFKGNCYLFVTDKIEWPDASANCMRNGGNLASIEDPAEQDFIKSNIAVYQDSQLSFWLGLYQTHRGDWHWLDKTPMDYVNWRDGQPDDAAYGLIKVIDGKWSTGNRWYDRAYICKTPKRLRNIQQTTSVSPVVDPKARGHIVLTIVLVIIAISIGAAIAIFLFKKSGRRFAIPEKLSTFDNPLFFNNERSSNLVDTNKLVANAEEENPGPVMDV